MVSGCAGQCADRHSAVTRRPCFDGISLTVVNVEEDRFSVALIPHTLEVTTLGIRNVGDPVNIETDILGKYVERLLEGRIAGE